MNLSINKYMVVACSTLACIASFTHAQAPLPVVTIAKDNTTIDQSCRIRISPGVAIPDRDGNGVIQVTRGGITIEFEEGTVLQGNYAGKAAMAPEQLTGVGISIINPQGGRITVKNARIEGYKIGIHADNCDSLTIDGGIIRDNFRQRLRSTPIREDASDWLWPHANDNQEWRKNYGAAVCIENSTSVTISNLTVRHTQNGIILDGVNQSQIFDNDCSFLSGWGLAMWRSSRNMISRNSFDFCIRGHVEGVYNRGQDSAGILVFEQCSANIFAENSATHSGDGFFGFAGKEAIGDVPPPSATGEAAATFDYTAAGCNDNLLMSNDFSYASAHGIEMTFSRRNRFIHNTLVENAICGIWGGYSNDSIISRNYFAGNGGMAYGLERGAINIEHGSGNIIHNNTFLNNRSGIHLWWDNDTKLLEMPGVKANYRNVTDNVITSNRIEINPDHPFSNLQAGKSSTVPLVGLHLRDKGIDHVKGTIYLDNTVIMTANDAVELLADEGISIVREVKTPLPEIYEEPRTFPGERSAFGLRKSLSGRHNIILDEYGPWDHQSPFVVPVSSTGSVHTFDVFGVSKDDWKNITLDVSNARANVNWVESMKPNRHRIEVRTFGALEEELIASYTLNLKGQKINYTRSGTIFSNTWECAAFSYSADPRTEEEKWRTDRMRTPQAAVTVPWVDFEFGRKGPKGLEQFAQQKEIAPGPDRFGLICVSTFMLPKGTWRFSTLSDDGVRVLVKKVVEGRLRTTVVLENWTHHAPTQDSGLFNQDEDGEVSVNVEYFQLDGHAVLKLEIHREN